MEITNINCSKKKKLINCDSNGDLIPISFMFSPIKRSQSAELSVTIIIGHLSSQVFCQVF